MFGIPSWYNGVYYIVLSANQSTKTAIVSPPIDQLSTK